MVAKKSSKKTKSEKKSEKKVGEFGRIQSLIDLVRANGISELEYEKNGERIRVTSGTAQKTVHASAAVVEVAPASVPVAALSSAPAVNPKHKQICSPLVGTFYRASAPTAEHFVKEGQAVKRGDVLCIVEAMKLMNEIECEHNGKIISVIAENGQPVEFGEPLFLIEV